MHILLSDTEIQQCREFSEICAENQQEIEFGQSDTVPRKIKEISRDNFIGKLTEVAFANMLKERYNISVELDFKFYPRGVWDKADAVINNWKIDVKGTRQGGKWMLVEWSKLDFRQKDHELSDLFIMGSVGWNRNTDQPTGDVDLIGCASTHKLKCGVKNTHVLRKGSYIPGTSTTLQADNFGIQFCDLKNDWDSIINYILSNEPFNLDDYPNPYSNIAYKDIRK